jgi:hypothetical protein
VGISLPRQCWLAAGICAVHTEGFDTSPGS